MFFFYFVSGYLIFYISADLPIAVGSTQIMQISEFQFFFNYHYLLLACQELFLSKDQDLILNIFQLKRERKARTDQYIFYNLFKHWGIKHLQNFTFISK